MLSFGVKRVVNGILVLWGVATLVFLLFSALPADPARMMLGQRDDAETLERIREKYGFDLPLYQQYYLFLKDLCPLAYHLNGDGLAEYQDGKYTGVSLLSTSKGKVLLKVPYLRTSFQNEGMPVINIIKNTLPNTVVLAVSAIVIAFILGVLLGMVSAYFHGKWMDSVINFLSIFGMAVPSFFAAIIIAYIFAFLYRDITGLPMNGSLISIDDYTGEASIAWKNLILPALTLGIRPLAVIVQLTRNSFLEVLSADFVRTARAKGIGKLSIWFKHVMRNALNPVITATSGWFASMLAGAVFVEYIFGWNGMGKEIVNALNNLDLPLVMGTVMVAAGLFVLINILVDFAYAALDPRIRLR